MKTLLLMLLLFSGCSYLGIKSTPEEKPKLNITMPDKLDLEVFDVIIVTKDNASKVFSDLESKNLKPVIFGMSGNDYKVLVLDMIKMKERIIILQDIIKAYKDYYESSNQTSE